MRLTTSFQRCARPLVSADAPASTSGVNVAGGIFISARTERIAVTRSTTQPISASAAGSLKSPVSSAKRNGGSSGSLGLVVDIKASCSGVSASALRDQGASTSRPSRSGRHRPEFFGDEGHERVQQFQDFVTCPRHHGPRLGLGGALLAQQHGLGKFEIPVAIDVPDETVDRAGRVIETIGLDRLGHLARRTHRLMGDPAVQRLLRFRRVEARGQHASVHLRKAAGIP